MVMRKVMVVDDDKEFLDELKTTLRQGGYRVKIVQEARKAVAAAVESSPDVILLDLKMQGMTGFEVANKLRVVPGTRNIPIIAMSGFFTENRDDPLLGFFNINYYLQKPIYPLNVIDKIERVCHETGKK
ncbi:MAG: response regulator [Candidatus Omnitrophica bacterium]|nr:response regulator [Candidatus Omnitrophota bacterium]